MTQTKEELLQGLAYVQGMLDKMQTVLSNYIAQERNFRKITKEIDPKAAIKKDVKKIVSISTLILIVVLMILSSSRRVDETLPVFIVLAAFFEALGFICKKIISTSSKAINTEMGFFAFMAMRKSSRPNIGILWFWCAIIYYICKPIVILSVIGIVVAAGSMGVTILIVVVLLDVVLIMRKNKTISEANQSATANNEQVRAIRKQLYDQYLALQRDLQSHAPDWFPPDYYNIEAVNFFIHAIRNGRADSVKEMVNLFESSNQHKEMVAYQQQQTQQLNQLVVGQQAIQGQLRFANMMQVLNFIKLDSIENTVGIY